MNKRFRLASPPARADAHHLSRGIGMRPEEEESLAAAAEEPESRPGGIPLYVWVLGAVVLAIPTGLLWGEGATRLNLLPSLIIRALSAMAAPLVVLAILSAIVSNDIRGRQ